MPGNFIDINTIVSMYNTQVRNQASFVGSAAWYEGAANFYPLAPGNVISPFGRPGDSQKLGPRAEPAKLPTDVLPSIAQGQMLSTVVFNMLHGWAMELTRVRRVRAVHLRYHTRAAESVTIETTALNARYAGYFPIPVHPMPGDLVTDTDLTTFLTALRNQVNLMRNTDLYGMDVVTCHSNCHSNCHSSRNRR
jgi:hypothetical protein